MIKVGDTLKTLSGAEIKVLFIKDDSYTCEFINEGFVATWQRDGDRLGYILHGYCAYDYSVDLTPKPVDNGAFGESVESGPVYKVRFHTINGLYMPEEVHIKENNPFPHKGVFNSKENCEAYCDALNCLQIDLRENSAAPVNGVEQWSLKFNGFGKLVAFTKMDGECKFTHALPWYETKEEAEKHLADSARIIESLKTMKGISN